MKGIWNNCIQNQVCHIPLSQDLATLNTNIVQSFCWSVQFGKRKQRIQRMVFPKFVHRYSCGATFSWNKKRKLLILSSLCNCKQMVWFCIANSVAMALICKRCTVQLIQRPEQSDKSRQNGEVLFDTANNISTVKHAGGR